MFATIYYINGVSIFQYTMCYWLVDHRQVQVLGLILLRFPFFSYPYAARWCLPAMFFHVSGLGHFSWFLATPWIPPIQSTPISCNEVLHYVAWRLNIVNIWLVVIPPDYLFYLITSSGRGNGVLCWEFPPTARVVFFWFCFRSTVVLCFPWNPFDHFRFHFAHCTVWWPPCRLRYHCGCHSHSVWLYLKFGL